MIPVFMSMVKLVTCGPMVSGNSMVSGKAPFQGIPRTLLLKTSAKVPLAMDRKGILERF